MLKNISSFGASNTTHRDKWWFAELIAAHEDGPKPSQPLTDLNVISLVRAINVLQA